MSTRARTIAALLFLAVAGCDVRRVSEHYRDDEIVRSTGGDIERGRAHIRRYGCHTCHTIPGVPGASGKVGPSLDKLTDRVYLAGRLENNVPNLINWIRHPHAYDSVTVMPEMGVTEQDARDIAAYLYTLR
jgi:cytochrome c